MSESTRSALVRRYMTSIRRASRRPRGRSHRHPSLRTSSSCGSTQRDPELAGEPGVLPVGGVVLAVGQHRGDRGAAAAGRRRRHGAQRVGQEVDLAVQRPRRRVRRHVDVLEQRAPGGVQVREARGRAHVVLQHEPGTVDVAHEVQPRDADPHVARHPQPAHLGLEVVGGLQHGRRDDALGDDPLVPVDVGHERVQRAHALREAALDGLPVGGGDHARDGVHVELEVALDRGEPHAGAAQRPGHVRRQLRGAGAHHRLQPGTGLRADGAVGGEGLVEAALPPPGSRRAARQRAGSHQVATA